MKIDFDELIYQITLRFDASITPQRHVLCLEPQRKQRISIG